MAEEAKDFKGIVRIASKDVKGDLPLKRALMQIKGIGANLADSFVTIVSKELNIDEKEKIGNLSTEQIKKIEEILENPDKYGIPKWMNDRQKDPIEGKDGHLIVSDLEFQQKKDIEFQKKMRSYRGVRHMFGLRTRGQRTRTTGRKGTTLGVIRKKQQPKKTGKKEGGGKKK